MDAITYSTARANLADTMDRVCEDHEPIIITRNGEQAVVMMSLEDFKALEETGSGDPLFLYNMGLAYRETGLLDDAIENFSKVAASGQKLFDALMMLGITHRDLNQYNESLQALSQAALLEDISADMKTGIVYEIAQTYKAMGDSEQALRLFREIQRENRDFKDVDLEIVKLAGGG